ncbi:Protein of uncharacterised function (DUF826) [Escherichia coli]|nr:Protein of uncharacterised function (DUF826) [Escherichia coli]STI66655.1 Protein of uncharacterised function (DUF826) [Escherichia coli]STI68322.1 Protein of uncharacterised function (DUF826) [Escherichia coli]
MSEIKSLVTAEAVKDVLRSEEVRSALKQQLRQNLEARLDAEVDAILDELLGDRLLLSLKTARVTVLFQMALCLSLTVAVSLSLAAK